MPPVPFLAVFEPGRSVYWVSLVCQVGVVPVRAVVGRAYGSGGARKLAVVAPVRAGVPCTVVGRADESGGARAAGTGNPREAGTVGTVGTRRAGTGEAGDSGQAGVVPVGAGHPGR